MCCDGGGQLSEHAGEIGIRFQAIRLGGFDQAVEAGGRFGAGRRVGEQPRFSAQNKWPDRILAAVVIDFDLSPNFPPVKVRVLGWLGPLPNVPSSGN